MEIYLHLLLICLDLFIFELRIFKISSKSNSEHTSDSSCFILVWYPVLVIVFKTTWVRTKCKYFLSYSPLLLRLGSVIMPSVLYFPNYAHCLLRYRRLPWTPLGPVWWLEGTITTWSFGISPAWTRPCRLSDRSSPVSGEFTSEKHRISTQLLNMWRISFIQTSSTLAAFAFAKVYTNSAHTRLLCFIEPHVNSVASSSFHSKWAFPKQMAELCEYLCVFILRFTGFVNRDQILFFGCGNQWGELERASAY